MIPYKYSLGDFDFVALSKQSRDPRVKQRLFILANLQDGKRQADIADMLKISLPTVKRTLRRFKESGVDELSDRPRSGAPTKLLPSEHAAFKEHILQLQQEAPGGRLTGYDVLDVLKKQWCVKCSLSTAYNLMHTLDLSRIICSSRHPKQAEEMQEAFKQTSEK
ncbi:MAG: transposase [Candidatus Electrothrix sp. AR4]|nr:transposase [Candidatus Electrothrix sp. AR4]